MFQFDVRLMYSVQGINDYLNTTKSTANTAATIITSSIAGGSMAHHIVKNNLLMMALPHHAQVLPSNMIVEEFDTKYHSIKGMLTNTCFWEVLVRFRNGKISFNGYSYLNAFQSFELALILFTFISIIIMS